MLAKNLLWLIILLTTLSCQKNQSEKATINYYITAPRSSNFQSIEFTFDYLQVIQKDSQQPKTVVGKKHITINLENPLEIYLGSSTIEAEEIREYHHSISEITVIRANDTIALARPPHADDRTAATLHPQEGEIINLNLVLDVDASIVLGVGGGQNWLNPQIAIQEGPEPIW